MQDLRYPIGKFQCPDVISYHHVEEWIQEIKDLPKRVRMLVSNFSDIQLNSTYRQGGWTARQVIHHIYDSHHNSYTRFKWALTENKPVIKAYREELWAQLIDYQTTPIELSVQCLEALHAKWAFLLVGLSDVDLERQFIHPATQDAISLKENIGVYAWHGNHHLAHLQLIAGNSAISI